ncbi:MULTISPECIES: polyprenyl synthetase family protein [Vagococcus]|uniref:Heptaprenyl diphosphate synthase component II n=1 Tax=Vagococcus fluvialis bH819 TaxID=1255619 RepID=A0A1X6WPS4_9ENTE|nr:MULTISPECIES: polyprenyl synthetase family protein [Vagococcus]SLM86270.1 Heptaprenyl diphosphate synthase component II [Vagococcus fluvialis bH819]HCM88903.1 polyprenyl synthetase family protein [Vagococcus sp.]
MEIHVMWNDYPKLKKELQKTLDLMSSSISLPNKEIENTIIEMFHSGGKLLRPAYLLLFSKLGKQPDSKKSIALAAAMETLHTATLIHDDIIDEADVRRGVTTLQTKFDKDVAVYSGDYLFIVCFKLLVQYTDSFRSIKLNTASMEKVLLGELGQMDTRYHMDITVDEYIQNISGKTAELFALSCFLGYFENGGSKRVAADCREIGKSIGLAFQIVDDILDYSQDEVSIGKPVLEDVKQGVYSLPLICALKENKKFFEPLLSKKELMTDEDSLKVHEGVVQFKGVEKAYELADFYTEEALRLIQTLPNNKANTKDTIYEITKNILTRKN